MTFAEAAGRLPIVAPESLFAERGLVVVAPHPDDETLGCGGMLAWAAEQGCLVHVVFLTDGERSHPDAKVDLRRIRRGEALLAATRLGLLPQNISFLGLPDAGLQMLGELDVAWIRRWVKALLAERSPCLVAITAPSDPHGDHQAGYAMVADAARNLVGVEVMELAAAGRRIAPAGRACRHPAAGSGKEGRARSLREPARTHGP
jgi:LmbE family N-acetylglucosaminyl deacetylase